MPVCLSRNLIVQDRLATNPEYWHNQQSIMNQDPLKTLPIIRSDSIKLVQEIGEGCFGKVYQGMQIYLKN